MKRLLGLMTVLILISNQTQAEFGSIVDIGLAGDLYFTDENANNGQGFVNLLMKKTWEDSQIWVDVGAGGLVGDTATSYVKAPQVFFRYGSKYKLILGRKRHQWSFADDFWNLGLTQPLFKWNEALPEKQGLTGVFGHIPVFEGALNLTLFGSLLYLPTQGASYELTDGKLTSSNPWFQDPVQVINLSGQTADLNFEIELPPTTEIVQQESIGAQIATPKRKKGFLFNSFFMDKPRNELILPFEGLLNLTTFTGDITVRPQVARHTLLGADIGWNFRYFETILSWIHESEVEYNIPGNTTYPIIPEQNILSFQQLIRLSRSQRIWLGYIKTNRQDNEIGGVFSNSQITTFLNRNRFEEALRVKWEALLFKGKKKYNLKTSFTYNQSLLENNIWLSTDVRWSVTRGIELFSHCDFFGGNQENIVNTDFISAYQNNDRCLVGGHYAF